MSDIVIYQGSGEWSAVYLDGKLQRVGDHYLADEWLCEHFGVDVVNSDDFLRGGNSRPDVAGTIDEIHEFRAEQDRRRRKADDLTAQAEALLAEAKALRESK